MYPIKLNKVAQMASTTLDHAKDNRIAILLCILFIYILYHIAFVPHLIVQNEVITSQNVDRSPTR